MSEKITVLMSVYKESLAQLKTSIESILNQSFSDFIYLIIIDNPDNLEAIDCIKFYSKIDQRIKYVINEKNLGLALSLNRGIDSVTTKYIARMDADDIALPDRLLKQYQYLESNSDIDLLGTNIEYIDSKGTNVRKRGNIPENVNQIKCAMKYINVLNHPTFMGKTEVFKKLKYRDLIYSQDYDFTCRLLELGYQVENINKYLLKYRLAECVSDNKILKQYIIKKLIQESYRKKIINKVDLPEKFKKVYDEINHDVLIKQLQLWNRLLSNRHRGIRFRWLIDMCRLFIKSRYIRDDIVSLFIYNFKTRD